MSLTILNTTALEDRRLRRDLQDTYAKTLDLVVNNSLKIAEAGIWDRPDITKHVESNKEDDVDVEKGLVKVCVLGEKRSKLTGITDLRLSGDRSHTQSEIAPD